MGKKHFCRDCRHRVTGFEWQYEGRFWVSRCHRPINAPLDLVTGNPPPELRRECSIERKPKGLFDRIFGTDRCLPEARYFALKGRN